MKGYRGNGHAYLVCPVLIEADPLHARHPSKWPSCAHGRPCARDHEHQSPPLTPEGHRVVDFFWRSGCDHIEEHFNCEKGCHDNLRCDCGRQLVHADLDDPYAERYGLVSAPA